MEDRRLPGLLDLHRCLLDRLFHLSYLREKNEFELFEAWSFLEQYESLNRVRSDPEFGRNLDGVGFSVTTEQKERARTLSRDRPIWRRPKAEDVAKRLDMRFLYSYGYDYASRHIHPMANDGMQDFFTITKLKPAPDFPDQPRPTLQHSAHWHDDPAGSAECGLARLARFDV